jgi:hypothetical protein
MEALACLSKLTRAKSKRGWRAEWESPLISWKFGKSFAFTIPSIKIN